MLSPVLSRAAVDPRVQPCGLIEAADPAKWSGIDSQSFAFRHKLGDLPLFELPRLAALSEKVFDRIDYGRYFDADEMKLGKPELKRRLRNAIEGVGQSRRWLALHFVNEMDPEYDAVLQGLLADVEHMVGQPIRQRMSWAAMTVFMNSPGLAVPYHFDHETNFLLQVHGEKDLSLYPCNDRWVLPETDVEDFYRHNPIATRYRDEVERTVTHYQLLPGVGVHHPPLAPHRIKNGDQVSISVSFYYTMPETEYRARVHQVNFLLRKLGLQPRPPGQSALVDDAKNRFIRMLSKPHPRTHDEALYSGIERLTAPARIARKMLHRAPHRAMG
jgi:hypothetical protein